LKNGFENNWNTSANIESSHSNTQKQQLASEKRTSEDERNILKKRKISTKTFEDKSIKKNFINSHWRKKKTQNKENSAVVS
jgi:hypothetical protein